MGRSLRLTLAEIDHNFSRAHRIVTSSILPIVEQYGGHSKEVWEGSRFWKQFFESSANVSLSGYEEQPSQHETIDNTVTEESHSTTQTTLETSESYETPNAQHISTDSIQDLDLSNLSISPSHSTPRPPRAQKANFADYPSPYEALRQEVNSTAVDATSLTQTALPETPGRPVFPTDAIARTPESSPFLPPPELHPEIFSSPERKVRIPGVSLLTPAKHKGDAAKAPSRTPGIWDSDEDDLEDDIDFGQSPPKTMQFHVPQNRLLKTPAKEASQRIVEDILTNAGMDFGEEEIDFTRELETQDFEFGAASPSVVRPSANIEDETF